MDNQTVVLAKKNKKEATTDMSKHRGEAGLMLGITEPKNEKEVTKSIIPKLRAHGWLCIRMQQNIGSHPGISDFICLKNGVLMFLELKGPKGKQNKQQKKFEEDINKAGGVYVLARKFDDIVERFSDDPGGYDFIMELPDE